MSRVQYCPNSDSRFQLMHVTVSGDIELNPGPTNCSVCNKVIARNHRALSCDQCTLWCHMKCGQVKLRKYKRLQQMDQFNWVCPACFLTALPFADAQTLNTSNLSNTSANSLPEFIKSRNDDDREILIMHLNISGIQNKFEEVKQLMKEFKAQVLFLTETKIDATYPTAQFKISGYDIYRNDRTKGGGGIMAFVSSRTPSKKLAPNRKFSTIEPLIVEAKFGKHNVVVVGIYRTPKIYR